MFRFVLFKGGFIKKQWYFNFEAPNGEVLFQSEGYSRKIDAQETIASIKFHAKDAEVAYADEV